jgi:hypothetical protein
LAVFKGWEELDVKKVFLCAAIILPFYTIGSGYGSFSKIASRFLAIKSITATADR